MKDNEFNIDTQEIDNAIKILEDITAGLSIDENLSENLDIYFNIELPDFNIEELDTN